MDTNEELKDATDALTREVHALGERLSAKELLYHRTQRLTKISLGVAAIAALAALISVLALVKVNAVLGCMGEWQAATSERNAVLNAAAEKVAKKEGERDAAMSVLVDYRGDPNNAETDAAKTDYRAADQAKIAAEMQLQFLRDQYPPPQIEDFCTNMEDSTPDPKATGE